MLRRHTVARFLRIAWLLPAGLVLLARPACSQVRIGELSTSLSGTIAPGYSADYGNMTASDHSWAIGGNGNFSGSFYSPNFLSFNVGLYLNQSRANSSFQSISNASGVNATANIFAGSHFPGSVNYSKAFNSEGNYAVPGLADYVTHGDSDTLGINWSENIPNAPSFSAGFQMGNSQYSVYGTDDDGRNRFHSVNLHSAYRVAGFNMGAFYNTGGGHSLIPEVVTGEQGSETSTDNSAYGFNVTHLLPLHGSASAGYSRSEWDSDYLGDHSTGTIDLLTTLASVRPTEKVSCSFSANYSDNLSGQLIESLVDSGGAVPVLNDDQTSDSLDLMSVVSYAPAPNVQTTGFVERRTQDFMGEKFGVTSYGGSAAYSREIRDGYFNSSVTATENTADQTGENTLGFSATENYNTEIKGWHVGASFGYSQNVQTLLITYMNSFYNFSGNARRRWGRINVSAGAGLSRTALTAQAGTANSSQSYNASFGYGALITATGSYAHASGQALATGAGLVTVPIPSPIVPSGLVSLFGGNSFSVGVSSSPVKKLTLAAAYADSTSDTSSTLSSSSNHNEQFNALVQYQVRKLNFNSGFARLEQGFSESGTNPQVISSFFIGVSRWFNFF